MYDEHVPPVNAFSETSALWSLMQGDPHEARRIVEEMTYSEKADFARQLRELHRMVAESSIQPLPTPSELR